MTTEQLASDFHREATTARRFLERIPPARMEWRPHPKSFTAGALGSHLVDCLRWVEPIFAGDELDFDPATYQPFQAASLEELLAGFDHTVVAASAALASTAPEAIVAPWRLKIRGTVWQERRKIDAFTDFTLHHLIHHRGQLSVYLRLLDQPVPSAYGPTADEG